MIKFKLATMTLAAAAAFILTADAHGQTAQLAEISARLPGFATDSYSGVLTTLHSYALNPKTWLGGMTKNLSIQFDGFTGTGAEYKQNMASVLAVLNWAVTPRFNGFAGLGQSGNINNFSISQLTLKSCGTVVGFSYSF